MDSNKAVGHAVETVIRLDETIRQELLSGVLRPGSRSVMFRFPEAGQHEGGDMFGAIIEAVDEQPDGLMRVRLRFWNDLAEVYVTPGSKFEVWYARTVGDGVVLPSRLG
jgi:hypothetical protein